MVGVITAGILLLQPIIPGLTYLLFGNLENVTHVRMALVGIMVGNLIPLLLTLFRADGKAWHFTVISLLQLIFQLALNILFMVWLHWGVRGVVWGILINGVFWSTVLVLYVLSSVGWRLEGRWIRPLFKYGLPLVPAALAQFLLHFSDRFFLVHYTSTAEIGLYSLAYRLGMLGSEMFNALNWAWWPWVFRVASRSHAEEELQKGASLVLILSALICAGVSLLADPIIRWMVAPSFWKAAQYVPVLSMAYWFFTATTPLSISAPLAKRIDLFAVANALAAGACLLFNFWLIPRYPGLGGHHRNPRLVYSPGGSGTLCLPGDSSLCT